MREVPLDVIESKAFLDVQKQKKTVCGNGFEKDRISIDGYFFALGPAICR